MQSALERSESVTGSESDIWELRIYDVETGRIDDMHWRMRDFLVPMFAKHKAPLAAAWEGVPPSGDLVFAYLLRWSDFTLRLRSWSKIYTDPNFAAMRTLTDRGRPIVPRVSAHFLSAIPGMVPDLACLRRSDQLRLQEAVIAKAEEVRHAVRECEAARAIMAGGRLHAGFEMLSGWRLPRVAIFETCPPAGDLTAEWPLLVREIWQLRPVEYLR